MEDTKNTNKKLRMAIFTAPFLIGSIYSVYSQATSTQNNAVSSLESNSIIQEIISAASSGYSAAGQYLSNFLSVNGVPSYVWTIITFLMTTLLFVSIYTFLFEIFMQKINISQNKTIEKSKILFIFVLSIFSAIAIGYAIPFLLNLYGFILLILVLIALFFFGRAAISYGRSFHHSIRSFTADIEKAFLNAEKEVKKAKLNAEKEVMNARADLSKEAVKFLEEGREKVHNKLENINNQLSNADKKFETTLSKLENAYKAFINNFINRSEAYFNQLQNQNLLSPSEIMEKNNFIRELGKKRDKINRSEILNNKKSIKDLFNDIIAEIDNLKDLASHKSKLENLLHESYTYIFHSQGPNSGIFKDMQDTIDEYRKVKKLLIEFYNFEDSFKRDIKARFRYFFHAPDNREYDIDILSALNKSKEYIREIEKLVDERIKLLENLLH
jgi:vacuolar-type H+-ATPase subunit H